MYHAIGVIVICREEVLPLLWSRNALSVLRSAVQIWIPLNSCFIARRYRMRQSGHQACITELLLLATRPLCAGGNRARRKRWYTHL